MMAGSRTLKLELLAVDKEFTRALRNAQGTAKRFGSVAAKGLRVAGIAAAAMGAAAVAGASKAVGAASDLEQSMGAVETVFGNARGAVDKFADQAAVSAGLSKREVNEMASVMGASLQSFGFEAEDAAGMTVELQQRAADMAATFGGPTADAVGAIGALMRGEADPIERFGVSIKQADVNARLLSDGLGELEGEERRLAEAQARLDLLMEQTANTTGTFARESDTLAGKQQTLKASLENSAASIGEALLPAAAAGVDMLQQLTDWLGPKIEAGVVVFTDAIGRVRAWWDENGPAIVTKIQDVAQAVVTWWTETAVPAIHGVRDALSEFWNDKAKPWLEQLRQAWTDNEEALSEAWSNIQSILGDLGRIVANVFEGAAGTVDSTSTDMGEDAENLADGLAGITGALETLTSTVETVTEWGDAVAWVIQLIVNPAEAARRAIDDISDAIRGMPRLDGFLSGAGNVLRNVVPGLAAGGLVTRPTLALVGEGSESEAVLPLSVLDRQLSRAYQAGASGRSSGGATIHVTGTMMDPEGVARAVDDVLRRSAARAGAFA